MIFNEPGSLSTQDFEKPRPAWIISGVEDLFKNLTCTFEGMSEYTEKRFIKIVKDLGGEIKADAKIRFIERSYFYETEELRNYYNVSYIEDSVELRKPLDIKSYRISSEKIESNYVDLVNKLPKNLETTQDLGMKEKEERKKRVINDVHSMNNPPKKLKTNLNLEMRKTDSAVNSKEWWKFPRGFMDADRQCGIRSCSFEPGPHEKHHKRSRAISLDEKIIIVRLIVTKQMYKESRSRSFWEQVHARGYLTHRSPEVLRGHYRKVLIPDIERTGFGLPHDIRQRFIALRIK